MTDRQYYYLCTYYKTVTKRKIQLIQMLNIRRRLGNYIGKFHLLYNYTVALEKNS